ncbi:arsenite efflux transporter metallochaperone ArsD [Mediannikoviicoccus vaginalis]|uniref:arsenite efflux transporter metallochaperone ArsD n=1 Tax=Mediannikoviicoccus vaginalis TaxID=2899727 RepID=UPI001F00CDC4|nr:arsenite efflux transporter metallochaperone ArsD [Mediannikoviicoccus vaginalis]
MKQMVIYDPAMCCPTGLCGPSIDKNLLRVSTAISRLSKKNIEVIRHNLNDEPQLYAENDKISKLLNEEGVDVLPITMVDNEVVKTREYPTNDEFVEFLDIPKEYIMSGLEIRRMKKNKENK